MSVADRLGTGSSFNSARRGRSARGRAKAVTQGDVPAYELVRLHLDEVSPTPLNPRRNFGTDEDKTRFGEELRQAQLAACVAVSRTAYLALWPDHEQQIGEAAHVLVNGERRFRSAVHVGLEALDFVIRDDLASSRETFINHLLKENLEREDFDVIERARGVQELVAVCAETSERGARTRAAEQLGRDRSWVTNQLVLLELPEELQIMLSAGTLAERDGRMLARYAKDNPGISPSALLDHLQASKDAAVRAKAEERSRLEALRAQDDGALLSADNNTETPQAAASATPLRAEDDQRLLSADNNSSTLSAQEQADAGLLSADNKPVSATAKPPAQRQPARPRPPATAEASTGAPDQAAASATDGKAPGPRQLPYDNAAFVANHLHRKMDLSVFTESARLMLDILREQHADAYGMLVRQLVTREQEQSA
nr:ParB/RepB/Spo0J family partition protein [Streptomyces sp. Xyl84]